MELFGVSQGLCEGQYAERISNGNEASFKGTKCLQRHY